MDILGRSLDDRWMSLEYFQVVLVLGCSQLFSECAQNVLGMFTGCSRGALKMLSGCLQIILDALRVVSDILKTPTAIDRRPLLHVDVHLLHLWVKVCIYRLNK